MLAGRLSACGPLDNRNAYNAFVDSVALYSTALHRLQAAHLTFNTHGDSAAVIVMVMAKPVEQKICTTELLKQHTASEASKPLEPLERLESLETMKPQRTSTAQRPVYWPSNEVCSRRYPVTA